MKTKHHSKRRFKKAKQKYRDSAWELRFKELKAYRRHGHCQVPSRSNEHPSMGHWVSHQRVLRLGFSRPFRGIPGLLLLGHDVGRMLGRLARFHGRFGHCRVPALWAGTRSLSGWVDWKTGGSLNPR